MIYYLYLYVIQCWRIFQFFLLMNSYWISFWRYFKWLSTRLITNILNNNNLFSQLQRRIGRFPKHIYSKYFNICLTTVTVFKKNMSNNSKVRLRKYYCIFIPKWSDLVQKMLTNFYEWPLNINANMLWTKIYTGTL